VAAAKAFDFTAEFEISFYFLVIKYSEAIYNCDRVACPVDDMFGIKRKLWRMRHRKNQCLSSFQGF
jgi:hypothetical protein